MMMNASSAADGSLQRMPTLDERLQQVRAILHSFERVIVAFSGGVDSTLLAVLAQHVLGTEQVLAVTADSPSLARQDLEDARRLARQLHLPHVVVCTAEVDDPTYQANSPARCYICKQELFIEIEAQAAARGIAAILYGAIGEDLLAERPGQRAAQERGVRAPLQEAGLTKADVRHVAKQLGLPNWNRPQNACLASRIPHGISVTRDKLRQVEQAEALLRAQGFAHVRVRHLGTHARIEVAPEETRRFQDAALCAELATAFERLGFDTIGVDRAGYRAGGADRSAADEVPLEAIARW